MGGVSPWARRRLRRGAGPLVARGGGGAKRPPAAAKADDLDALKKAVDDAASVGGGLWFSYLFVMFYLAVSAGAVTHADLFFEKPVKLPFLNLELPLLAFFALAPFLFLIVHAYTLLHLVMLTEKAKRYDEALYRQLGGEESKAIRDGLRGQLPSNIFVQFLAGPPRMRDGAFGIALRGVGWLTLIVGPVLLLLLLQLQFLPYHSSPITWAHRVAVILDLGLIWWLWRKIVFWGEGDDMHRFATWNWPGVGVAVSVVAVVFSVVIATYRGEPRPDWIADLDKGNWVPTVHDAIFESEVDQRSGRRLLPFSDTLVLSNVNALVELGVDDPRKVEWRDFIFRAAGRHLEGAVFDYANMGRIDFDGANLERASIYFAQFDRSSFRAAQLQDAQLSLAHLHGALLAKADLRRASFVMTDLQGAALDDAHLEGATLLNPHLQGASLNGAELQFASLVDADLRGASLRNAQLGFAELDDALLQGASLQNAELVCAELFQANLEAASLEGAQLQGASLGMVKFEATDFDQAFLWRADLNLLLRAKPSLSQSEINWGPFLASQIPRKVTPWDQATFDQFRAALETLPAGNTRESALRRIRRLDCADETLPTCKPPGVGVSPLQGDARFARLGVPRDDFRKALTEALRTLVCPGDEDTIYVIRGDAFRSRLEDAGAEAKLLVGDLLDRNNETCPVAAVLSDADRSRLAKIEAKMSAPLATPAQLP